MGWQWLERVRLRLREGRGGKEDGVDGWQRAHSNKPGTACYFIKRTPVPCTRARRTPRHRTPARDSLHAGMGA